MKIRENGTTQRNVAKRLMAWAFVVAGVLMIPLLTNAPWTGSDFVFAGVVLFICATVYELATKNTNNPKHRAAVGAGVLFFIFLVMGWAAAGP